MDRRRARLVRPVWEGRSQSARLEHRGPDSLRELAQLDLRVGSPRRAAEQAGGEDPVRRGGRARGVPGTSRSAGAGVRRRVRLPTVAARHRLPRRDVDERSELTEVGSHLGAEARVAERESEGGRDVGDQRSSWGWPASLTGPRPARRARRRGSPRGRVVCRQLERPATIVDVAVLVGQPEPERHRRIAERALQGAASGTRSGSGAELGDEVGYRRLGPAAPQQVAASTRTTCRWRGRRRSGPAGRSPTPAAGSRRSGRAPTRTSALPRAPARRPFEPGQTYGRRCRPRPRRPGPPSRG